MLLKVQDRALFYTLIFRIFYLKTGKGDRGKYDVYMYMCMQ